MVAKREAANAYAHKLAVTFLALGLLWFALWTVTVNAFVLAGSYFQVLPWCLLSTTVLAAGAGILFLPPLLTGYELGAVAEVQPRSVSYARLVLLIAAALAGAAVTQITRSAAVAIAAATMTSALAYRLWRPTVIAASAPERHFAWEFLLVVVVIFALYYFGHLADWDDANFLNLAAKAPLSRGHIYQFDTMVGDGPHPIHLPTYKLHSYELLGATISYLLGLEPILVAHLLLPIATLLMLACVIALVLRPAAGKHWVCAALFASALLYANATTLQSWGTNGLPRFHQNHGPLVMIVPLLAAGLTIRWFMRRQRVDLLGLALLNICAVGISANGLFVGPAAIGFVALAFLAASPKANWSAAWRLLPTLIYPAIIGAVVVLHHLALPSEVATQQSSYSSFRNVIGWRAEGLALLALIPLAPLAARDPRSRFAAAVYFPAALLVVLNPLGWSVVSAVTGNLGYRIFWAIPGTFIAGMVLAKLVEFAGIRSKLISLSLGLAALAGGIMYNQFAAAAASRVQWHQPGLRVPKEDYVLAKRLASLTPAGCKALVPARYAVWIVGLKGGPYVVATSSLYLTHYRLTEPKDELSARWALFDLVNGEQVTTALPSVIQLHSYGMDVGLVATDRSNPNLAVTEQFARALHLLPITGISGLQVWRGTPCRSARA
ncbi:MAG: hypothetical protein ACJ8FT_07210 [Sphingomonas sp.]